MDYRKYNQTYYVRLDKGDEIISSLLQICRKEDIASAIFSGIGGCKHAEIQTFIPESGTFETQELSGMLELISLNGNIVRDEDGSLFHHTHAMFSFKKDLHRHLFEKRKLQMKITTQHLLLAKELP